MRPPFNSAKVNILLIALIISVISSLFFYIEAYKNGMRAKRWGMAAAVAGPMVMPLFNVHKRMHTIRVTGKEAVIGRF